MSDNETKLKPCPFCGKPPFVAKAQYIGQVRDDLPPDGIGVQIYCGNKNCDLWPSTREEATFEKAAAVWNRRAGA